MTDRRRSKSQRVGENITWLCPAEYDRRKLCVSNILERFTKKTHSCERILWFLLKSDTVGVNLRLLTASGPVACDGYSSESSIGGAFQPASGNT